MARQYIIGGLIPFLINETSDREFNALGVQVGETQSTAVIGTSTLTSQAAVVASTTGISASIGRDNFQPQRTNETKWWEVLRTPPWTPLSMSTADNAIAAPDTKITADLITITTT